MSKNRFEILSGKTMHDTDKMLHKKKSGLFKEPSKNPVQSLKVNEKDFSIIFELAKRSYPEPDDDVAISFINQVLKLGKKESQQFPVKISFSQDKITMMIDILGLHGHKETKLYQDLLPHSKSGNSPKLG